MNNADVLLLEAAGWVVECESPFQIRHASSNSFATNLAANEVLAHLHRTPDSQESRVSSTQPKIQALEDLAGLIDQLINLAELAAHKDNPETWELAYDLVFSSTLRERLLGLLGELGLEFRWSDPDGSYKDDVLAYTCALSEFKRQLDPFLKGL